MALSRVGFISPTCLLGTIQLSSYAKRAIKGGSTQTFPPLNFSDADVSRTHYLDQNEIRQVFPHGLSSKLATELEALGRGSWVLRQQSFDIINVLNEENPKKTPKFLLYGDTGCGKSVCLSQVIHWCARAGWIIVHVPNVFDWTHSLGEWQPSPRHPGLYDQPQEAVTWLKNFRTTNAQHLTEIRLSEAHNWTKREMSEVNDDLGKVIEVGLLKPNIATDVVTMVMKMVAEQQDRRVLLAVDGFNGCFSPTSLRQKTTANWLEPQELGLVRAVLESTMKPQYPGGIVLALSRTKMYRHSVSGHTPEQLLGSKGCKNVISFNRHLVPNFQREEMDTWLTSSFRNRWISREPTESVSNELWLMSRGNPAELSRLCKAL